MAKSEYGVIRLILIVSLRHWIVKYRLVIQFCGSTDHLNLWLYGEMHFCVGFISFFNKIGFK